MRGCVFIPIEARVKSLLQRIEILERDLRDPEMKQWFSEGKSNEEITQLFETMQEISKKVYEHSFFLKIMSRNYQREVRTAKGIKIKR